MSVITGGNVIDSGAGEIYQNAGAPSAGTDEVQTLTIGGTPEVGSTFRITFEGWKTAAIPWSSVDATLVASIDAALEALPNIGAGGVAVADVTLTSGVGTASITFSGANLAKKDVGLAVASEFKQSTGAASAGTAAIATTTPGVTATARDAGKGALLVDTTNGKLYINTGAALAPTWTVVGTQT
jgi:hypothetical protein